MGRKDCRGKPDRGGKPAVKSQCGEAKEGVPPMMMIVQHYSTMYCAKDITSQNHALRLL